MKCFFDKTINKAKLTLTTRCNLSCPYCFVNKTGEDMEWGVAKKAVDILIKSGGKNKLLSLYGGESLLNFELIKKICPYASEHAKKYNKNLTISICTNLILLKKEHLELLNKYDVKVIVSLGGAKESHDKERVFANNDGTYDLVAGKLNMLFERMPKGNIGVSFCVFPDEVKNLWENFLHLLKLGFDYFNFEVIRNYKTWRKDDIAIFAEKYKSIAKYTVKEVNHGNFIFLNPVNWEIGRKRLSSMHCLFNYLLEVYPGGDIAFSPFLLNKQEKEKYLVGNLKKEEQYMFDRCNFSPDNSICKSCISSYFSASSSDAGADATHRVYQKISKKAADFVLKKAETSRKFKDYITKIKKDICF